MRFGSQRDAGGITSHCGHVPSHVEAIFSRLEGLRMSRSKRSILRRDADKYSLTAKIAMVAGGAALIIGFGLLVDENPWFWVTVWLAQAFAIFRVFSEARVRNNASSAVSGAPARVGRPTRG